MKLPSRVWNFRAKYSMSDHPFVTDGKCIVIAVGRGAQASKNLARSVRERLKSEVKNPCFSVIVTTKKNTPQANCAVFEPKSEFKKWVAYLFVSLYHTLNHNHMFASLPYFIEFLSFCFVWAANSVARCNMMCNSAFALSVHVFFRFPWATTRAIRWQQECAR